jgi:hypothetical protein
MAIGRVTPPSDIPRANFTISDGAKRGIKLLRRDYDANAADPADVPRIRGEDSRLHGGAGILSVRRNRMKHGFEGLLEFLALLRQKKITFRLEQQRDDAIMILFTLVAVRVEVEWFADEVEFSYFTGDEGVSADENDLLQLIDKHWD